MVNPVFLPTQAAHHYSHHRFTSRKRDRCRQAQTLSALDRRKRQYNMSSTSAHHQHHSERNSEGSSSSQRKRIPVACGRCRKRKIRCSGDNGNGDPCINCLNAGINVCQFLRMSSHDADHFKSESLYTRSILEDNRGHQQLRGGVLEALPTHIPSTTMTYDGSSTGGDVYRNMSRYGYLPSQASRGYVPWGPASHDYYGDHSIQGVVGYAHNGLYTAGACMLQHQQQPTVQMKGLPGMAGDYGSSVAMQTTAWGRRGSGETASEAHSPSSGSSDRTSVSGMSVYAPPSSGGDSAYAHRGHDEGAQFASADYMTATALYQHTTSPLATARPAGSSDGVYPGATTVATMAASMTSPTDKNSPFSVLSPYVDSNMATSSSLHAYNVPGEIGN
ncbi:Fungal Zn(2)-Cys(6) binuclear cluster domain [Geosmithia morbida]|uniref:Fungal Zn(2)-Cys(6) binuclear cluster domain n=1 Tax=Geosmithia morbida TaxID=1094350 RepID=A0A9P4YQT2_9HYPO|nr:Fungal Zn(2)-Cys(6) binuclear cluster domain [Geosmithia morbida]KAF4120069.1 Fungal Zn(2)-Cys(6) binuclear cluster domain [Geosmithia morbida]